MEEAFEKFLAEEYSKLVFRKYFDHKEVAHATWKSAWNARQPEIDALNNRLFEIHRQVGESGVKATSPIDALKEMRAEIDALKAEVKELQSCRHNLVMSNGELLGMGLKYREALERIAGNEFCSCGTCLGIAKQALEVSQIENNEKDKLCL